MKPPAQARGHVGGRERALEGRLNGGALRAARRGENDQRISGQRMSGQRVSGQRVSGSIAPPGLHDSWMDIHGLAPVATFTRPSGAKPVMPPNSFSALPARKWRRLGARCFFLSLRPQNPGHFLDPRPAAAWNYVAFWRTKRGDIAARTASSSRPSPNPARSASRRFRLWCWPGGAVACGRRRFRQRRRRDQRHDERRRELDARQRDARPWRCPRRHAKRGPAFRSDSL